MSHGSIVRSAGVIIATAVLSAGTVRAADAPATQPAAATQAEMQAELNALKARIAGLEKTENENWMSQQRTAEIESIVKNVLADARTHDNDAGNNIGYNNGFYVQTTDRNFRLQIDGYTQFRYTFARDQLVNPGAYAAASKPKAGDASGFDFRYARLYFSGNVFTPNITYMIMGDFGGDSGNANDFQLVDDYIGYRFNDTFNIRVGSYLVPFSRLEYNSSGLGLVDFPEVLNPFDPARSFGVSLWGEPIKNKLTYEVMINNGPNSNHDGRAAQVGGATDNRFGLATRWQYFGGTGKPADFNDESDLRKDKSTLAWMLGGAVGYDSVNQSSNAFPGKQGGSTLSGVGSNDSPGFTTYPVNGDLYRATIDGSLKYQGLEITTAAFFEQIDENPGAGVSLPAGYAGKSSFFQAAYYGQVGYMFAPKWEVVGRAGEFFTEGSPNRMNEFTLGVNYFIIGKNVKLQADVTYIPEEAAVTSSTLGSSQNTQDLITQVQLQLKF